MTPGLDWNANDTTALAYAVLAVGAIGTGAWSLFNYRAARRARAAEWTHSLFHDFYLSPEFRQLRTELEYNFFSEMGPLLERRLYNREVPLSTADVELLSNLDTTLNYLEFILYLLDERRVSESDVQAIFDYWFAIACDREHAALRRYVAHFGFEYLAKRLQASDSDCVFLYGTLMTGEAGHDEVDVQHSLRRVSPATIEGSLYDLGLYPGLILDGAGLVSGELYEPREGDVKRILDSLDRFERFLAAEPGESLYLRRFVRLHDPDRDAWVYIYNQTLGEAKRIVSGNWAKRRQ